MEIYITGDLHGDIHRFQLGIFYEQESLTKEDIVLNVLAFPGIFRDALEARAGDINDAMKIAAAHALAGLISEKELNSDYIIPAAFDPRVKDAVASAVAQAARDSGVARL